MNGISRPGVNIYQKSDTLLKNTNEKRNPTVSTQTAASAGRLVMSPSTDAVIYTPTNLDKTVKQRTDGKKDRSEYDVEVLNSAIATSRKTISEFRELVRKLIYKQAEHHTDRSSNTPSVNLTEIGVPQAAADEINRLSAKFGYVAWTGEVGENDYWGVDATAQRIFDFAVSLSGGDQETLGMLKESIHKAFKECEELFGGKLPDISYKTLDKIDALFDEYEKQPETITAD